MDPPWGPWTPLLTSNGGPAARKRPKMVRSSWSQSWCRSLSNSRKWSLYNEDPLNNAIILVVTVTCRGTHPTIHCNIYDISGFSGLACLFAGWLVCFFFACLPVWDVHPLPLGKSVLVLVSFNPHSPLDHSSICKRQQDHTHPSKAHMLKLQRQRHPCQVRTIIETLHEKRRWMNNRICWDQKLFSNSSFTTSCICSDCSLATSSCLA